MDASALLPDTEVGTFDAVDAVEPIAAAAPEVDTERAQAVRCGDRWIAFPYGWSRNAVEQLQLSAVPGAPTWLAGAANVEGRIVPVIDLAAWLEPGRFVDAQAKDARLLVGGEGDDTVGVLFQGLPRLVHVSRQPRAQRTAADRLSPYVTGEDPNEGQLVAVNASALVGALIEELALP